MSDQVLVTRSYLEDTGDAIREKLETDLAYTPAEFGAAIRSIEGGAGEDAVKYTEQTPTAEQQAQARTNIDAAKNAAFSGGQTVAVQRNGARIVVNDTIDARLPTFTLNGKSTQAGTPSPENPANIVTAGSSGSIDVICADDGAGAGAVTTTLNTPNGLPGIPVTSGGNYTDAGGQQWICDTIDKETGVYTQRCAILTLDGTVASDWRKDTTSSGYRFAYPQLVNVIKRAANNSLAALMCSNYPIVSADGTWGQSNRNGIAVADNGGMYVTDVDLNNNTSTVADLMAEFSANPMTIVYALATPVTTPLTAAQIAALDALLGHEGATVIYTTDAVQPEMAASLLTGVSGGAGIVPAPDSGSQYLGSDGAWHTPDDEPKANSTALINSGAVYAALQDFLYSHDGTNLDY